MNQTLAPLERNLLDSAAAGLFMQTRQSLDRYAAHVEQLLRDPSLDPAEALSLTAHAQRLLESVAAMILAAREHSSAQLLHLQHVSGYGSRRT